MDWLSDAWSGVKKFFGGDSDEEKRRKAEEARQRALQEQQRKQAAANQNKQPTFAIPTITNQPSPFTPQQQDKRPTAENPFMLDNEPKVEPPKFDKSEADQISGFFVMSPASQKAALDKVRSRGSTPEERLKNAKEAVKSGDKNKIRDVVGTDVNLLKKASDEVTAERKTDYENRKKTIGNIPVVGTFQNWGAGLASTYGKATGNQDLVDRAQNERNLLSLGMTSEELGQYDEETQKKLRILQNVVTGLGVLDAAGLASLAKAPILAGGKEALKAGIRSQAGRGIIKEAAKQTGRQYRNNIISGALVGGVADPAIQAYIKNGEVDWSSVPSSMLQGGLWAAAMPEFSGKQKLVQKMKAGNTLTSDESRLLNEALRDVEGADIPDVPDVEVPRNQPKTAAPLEEDARIKIEELNKRSQDTPVPEGMVRLYQTNDNNPVPSPNYFDNTDILANWINGRRNANLRFVDVPESQAKLIQGEKGKDGVYEIDGEQPPLQKAADEAKEVIDDVQAQAAQQAEGGSKRGMSYEDVMNTLRERNRVYNEADPATKAEIDARAAQKNPDDVTFDTPYSREAVYADLTGMGLTPADITNLTQRYGMTAQDWRAVMNATGNTGNARSLPALFDSQIRKVLNKERVQAPQPTPRAVATDSVDADMIKLALTGEVSPATLTPKDRAIFQQIMDSPQRISFNQLDEAIAQLSGEPARVVPEVPVAPVQTPVTQQAADIDTVTTGTPIETTLYRGSGETKQITSYNDLGIFGNDVRYYTPDADYAKKFGENVETVPVRINNPLVIDSDVAWREIVTRAGQKYTNPVGLPEAEHKQWVDSIRKTIEAEGFDGVVIRVPDNEQIGKGLQRTFGESQVVPFKAATPPAPQPVMDGGASRFIDTPEGTVDTTTGEIIDTPPSGTPPVEQPTSRTVSTYENDIKEATEFITDIMTEAEKQLRAADSSWETVSRKIQLADRNNTAPDLTDVEARLYTQVRDVLDTVLVDAQKSGRAAETGRREWYLPQAKEGSVRVPETMEDIYNTGFGYDKSRKNAIDLEDLDYGFDPTVDYYVRGTASESVRKQTIFESYRSEAPNAPIEQIEAATELRYANDQNINKLTENPKADPDAIDTVGNQKKIAETLGIQRVDNNAKLSRGLNVRDALDNAGVLGDGFNQYRRAQALSQNFESPEQLFAAVRQSPAENGLGLTHITRDRAAKIVERLGARLERAETPEHQQALMANAIRALSKANIDEMMLKTNFTDPALSSLVNGEYNRIAIGFNKATSTANSIGTGIRRVMNSSMRGFNLNSSLTEMTDVINAMHIYGTHAWKNLDPRGTQAVLDRWGQSGIVARMDNPDKAAEVFDALAREDTTTLKRLSDSANTVEEKLALYRYAENYKAAVFLKSAEDFWNATDPTLQGTALTNRILDEFDKNMLPLDHFTRVFKSDNQAVKLLTQYLDWNILNTRQQARNLVGANDSGMYRDMSRAGRITRNAATNLIPRMAVGMVRGVPIITTIGVLDPLGIASQDYSGIQDKNVMDEIMGIIGVSPLLSLTTGAYFNYRQDEETAKNYEGETPPEDARGNATERTLRNVEKMLTPYGGQIGSYDQLLRNFGFDVGAPANGRGSAMVDAMQDGYSENKNGRVQYLTPDNPLDVARGWLMGKNNTNAGREYSGTPDIFSVMAGDATLADLFTSNPTVETLTGSQGDYIRPVVDNDFTTGMDDAGNAMTKNFNEMIKNAESREQQEAILAQARDYNEVLDAFRRENPNAAEAYDKIMSNDDLVSPEYWREIVGTNADGSINLDIFKMIGDRKKQLAESLGAPYDPMYDLPDDRARSLLQLKATATGDDIALRNILYKSDWYNDYVADRSAYYDKLPEATDNESRQSTERVKQWNEYDKQLNSLSMLNTPDLERQFPYNAAYKAAEREYESKTGKEFFGSPESDAWWGQYGQSKKAEDAALDAAKLEIINQMRVIEGHPPMNEDQYAQATEIANTSGGGGGGGGGRSFDFIPEFYNSFTATNAPDVKTKQVTFNPSTSVGRRTNSRKTVGGRSAGRDNGGYSL